MVKTLGSGSRAKNGQFRRRSKFHPCVQCGAGTTFLLCPKCAERNQAYKRHTNTREVDLANNEVQEGRAIEVFQQRLFEGWGK